jgi:hypothetical protein
MRSRATDTTEDTLSRRPVLSGGWGFVHEQPGDGSTPPPDVYPHRAETDCLDGRARLYFCLIVIRPFSDHVPAAPAAPEAVQIQ